MEESRKPVMWCLEDTVKMMTGGLLKGVKKVMKWVSMTASQVRADWTCLCAEHKRAQLINEYNKSSAAAVALGFLQDSWVVAMLQLLN